VWRPVGKRKGVACVALGQPHKKAVGGGKHHGLDGQGRRAKTNTWGRSVNEREGGKQEKRNKRGQQGGHGEGSKKKRH